MSETKKLNPDDYVLILSAGGSPEPLLTSIDHYQPGYVIFVASRGSHEKVQEILRKTNVIFRHETITLSDYQNLLACVRDIRLELPKKLDVLGLPRDILLVADITGGTKVMSAALALVMLEHKSRFTYVGGDARTKNGLGTVESGHEIIMPMDNPWDAMGLVEAKTLARAFNAGQFAAAKEMANAIKDKDGEYRPFYDSLSQIIEAFRNWDIFDYRPAKTLFEAHLNKLRPYNNRAHAAFCPLFGELQKSFAYLEKAANDAAVLRKKFQPLTEDQGDAYVRDLVANARRRAERGYYDDAAARLYSAAEKTAKILLARKGVNNAAVPKTFLAEVNGELAAKHERDDGDEVKLPLTESFKLLCSLAPEHPTAQAWRKHETALANTLKSRNGSLLAHGYTPVLAEHYKDLFAVVLDFLNISEADLPDFPKIDPDSIIF